MRSGTVLFGTHRQIALVASVAFQNVFIAPDNLGVLETERLHHEVKHREVQNLARQLRDQDVDADVLPHRPKNTAGR